MSERQSAQRTYIKDLVGKELSNVGLFGWVNARRDHGKIIFFDLRDSTGLLQTVVTPKEEAAYKIAESLSNEDVIEIKGELKNRPENNINPDLPTGKLELTAKEIKIIGKSKELPLPIDSDGAEIDESVRLRYRYLDLRRERLQKNLKIRHQLGQAIREFLNNEGFIEVETPYLSKTTPEGARDFLVPSRLQKGNFYALAQSPQQYKQLLMIAGIDRYYQFPRAFRDEDLRADRQLEHTQIDSEMAFVNRSEILDIVERLMIELTKKMGKSITKVPFPRFTYKEAMEKFGSDKFDLRNNKEDNDEIAFAFVTDFPLFEYNENEKRWTFSHNPFTAPLPEDVEKLMSEKDIASIGSQQYDLVANGLELMSGSVRIHEPKVQRQSFKVMGFSEKEIEENFGHILEAYEFGAPVHGGFALGFDRLTAVFANEPSVREVIAFPVSSSGQTSVMDAPSPVAEEILRELGIKKIGSKE